MRVILEVVSGPDEGRKVPLRAGQRLQVGRTELADLTLAVDGHMSGLHFAMETDVNGCFVEDLGSSNGTAVNETPVRGKVALRDEDRLHAGRTDFVVHIEGEFRETISASVETGTARGAVAATPIAAARPSEVCYQLERGNSALPVLHGSIESASPQALAALLARDISLYLVIDFSKVGAPVPEQLAEPEYLFNWFPEESRETYCQIILSGDDPLDLPAWIEKSWGKDAVVCLFSQREPEEVLEHLRRTAGAYARPTILRPHLQLAAPDAAQNLLGPFDAVLIDGTTPESWNLIAAEAYYDALQQSGFAESHSHTSARPENESAQS